MMNRPLGTQYLQQQQQYEEQQQRDGGGSSYSGHTSNNHNLHEQHTAASKIKAKPRPNTPNGRLRAAAASSISASHRARTPGRAPANGTKHRDLASVLADFDWTA